MQNKHKQNSRERGAKQHAARKEGKKEERPKGKSCFSDSARFPAMSYLIQIVSKQSHSFTLLIGNSPAIGSLAAMHHHPHNGSQLPFSFLAFSFFFLSANIYLLYRTYGRSELPPPICSNCALQSILVQGKERKRRKKTKEKEEALMAKAGQFHYCSASINCFCGRQKEFRSVSVRSFSFALSSVRPSVFRLFLVFQQRYLCSTLLRCPVAVVVSFRSIDSRKKLKPATTTTQCKRSLHHESQLVRTCIRTPTTTREELSLDQRRNQ